MDSKMEVKASKNNRKGKWLVSVLLIILLAALAFCVGFAYNTYNSMKEQKALQQQIDEMERVVNIEGFYEGIFLDDIPLGGKTLDEARVLLSQRVSEHLEQINLSFEYKDKSWVFAADDLKAYINWEEKLQDAYEAGRTGKLENRYQKVLDIEEGGLKFVTSFTYDEEKLKKEVKAIAESIHKEPKNATISFDPKTEKFNITNEETGYTVDGDELVNLALKQMNEWKFSKVTIEPKILYPDARADDLGKATQLISKFSTSVEGNAAGRRTNVELALKMADGFKLNPGEVFSFNTVVGDTTAEKGFKMAPVITADKRLVDGMGGGVCQSSTTLYNAALMADLEIVERYHHSFPVSYVPKGLDASIYYPTADLKFKNNRETPVFIKTYSKNNRVYVEFYGEPLPDGEHVELESVVTSVEPAPKPKYIEDKEGKYVSKPGGQKLHVPSREGYRATSYKVYYKGNKEVRREVIVKDYYVPIQGVIYYR